MNVHPPCAPAMPIALHQLPNHTLETLRSRSREAVADGTEEGASASVAAPPAPCEGGKISRATTTGELPEEKLGRGERSTEGARSERALTTDVPTRSGSVRPSEPRHISALLPYERERCRLRRPVAPSDAANFERCGVA